MIRLIILLLIICACVYGYKNYDTIKDTTLNSIKNEKTIQSFNAIKEQNKERLNDALKH